MRLFLIAKTMEILKKLQSLNQFITPYEYLWNYEVLNFYPERFPYKKEWIEELEKLDDHSLWKFDSRGEDHLIQNKELLGLLRELKRFSEIQENDSSWKIPRKTAFKMGQKKNHELSRIIPKIKELHEKYQFEHMVDLGGGLGHLSRSVSHHSPIKSYCLDCDGELLKKGVQREEHLRNANPVRFIHAEIGKPIKGYSSFNHFNEDYNWEEIIHPDVLMIGLHTCGSLSNEIYDLYLNRGAKTLFHFGCCYHKADPSKHFNLSHYCREKGPRLTTHALTLASGPNEDMSFEEFLFKKRVKYYRNTLHLYMIDQGLSKGFEKVGPSMASLYLGPFSNYALSKLPSGNPEELDAYYLSESNQKIIQEMLLANLIRSRFSRVIELYILLDRARYFQEKGHEVEVTQFFKGNISPRNIGLVISNP